jgi:hypothetical protein
MKVRAAALGTVASIPRARPRGGSSCQAGDHHLVVGDEGMWVETGDPA